MLSNSFTSEVTIRAKVCIVVLGHALQEVLVEQRVEKSSPSIKRTLSLDLL